MANDLSTIERAFQLAREGKCRTIDDIRRTLTAERYDGVGPHLDGSTIKKQLLAVIAKRT